MTSAASAADVVVIGAGIVGLASAAALAREPGRASAASPVAAAALCQKPRRVNFMV